MKVVWITPGFRGDEREWFIPALYNLARRLRAGCDLHVVALRYPDRQAEYSVGGIPVYSLGCAAEGLAGLAGQWSRAAALVRRLRPDVLHAYWVLNSGVIAAGFTRRVPVLVTAAGGEVVHLPGIGYGEAGRFQTRALVRWALRRAAAAALSEYYAERVRRFLGGLPVRCTPWGINPDDWRQVSPQQASAMILSVGSLEPVKGLDVLLDAYVSVRRRIPTARLRLVGGGAQRTQLNARVSALGLVGSVELTGWIPHTDMARIYAGAGLYTQASYFESQGIALLEAAACGLPVAGTNVGVLRDLAPDAAVAAEPGQPGALADAMVELLLDRDRAAALAERARQIAVERFSLERVARELLELYAELAREGSRW